MAAGVVLIMNRDIRNGFIYSILGAMTYGMNPLFALPMYNKGFGAEDVLFYRYLLSCVILAGLVLWRKKSFRLPGKLVFPAIAGGLLCGSSSASLYLSYNEMDAGIASTLLFVYPVMVAVMMTAFFKEKLSWQTTLGLLGALAGIAILYRGGDGATLDTYGVILTMISAFTYAVYMVMLKTTDLGKLPADVLIFYVMAGGIPIFLVYSLFCDGIQLPVTASAWSCALALALFPTVISFLLMTLGIRYIGATRASILGALEPVTAVVFGIMIYGEAFTFRLCLGTVVIIAAVTLVVALGDKKTNTQGEMICSTN